ncbi:inositol monophosphatase family protein [Aquibacillus rhizosphaerae]|uniref:Inositol-1-monophosphatase n=1 Tax=Aquibacillus rhizosphaerae TaxID=3051431 RepID=A0ABT7LD59_9BACI|nr:inositol monophosphatase family protein [Aquibacillus sp. LR5S19]MDL4842530.1 inositol monophosphatase family protein [Aquibacillus sp. LR5S19]
MRSLHEIVKSLEGYHDVAKSLILKAGEKIREKVNNDNSVTCKLNAVDLVTEVDKSIEVFLIENLSAYDCECLFLSEETNANNNMYREEKKLTWVIDPLDGTMNFVHSFPRFSISIALCRGTQILIGLVLDVTTDTLYSAIRGQGAFRNGKRISVSTTTCIENSLIAFGFAAKQWEVNSNMSTTIASFIGRARGLRITGSSALDLASVACGELDSFWHYGLAPWDVAAGILLVEEAGGSYSDLYAASNGINLEWIIASNGIVHQSLLDLLRKGM